MSTLKNIDWKDVGKRAGKTFVQAFIASIGMLDTHVIVDLETAKAAAYSICIAGISAGLSAVWNMFAAYLK